MPPEKDTLQRFLFEQANIRGEIVRLNQSYQEIFNRHPYPAAVREYLGQALSAAALLSATIKFTGKLTLQVQTDGPINLLVVQSNEKFQVRGLAKWEGDVPVDNFVKAFGHGHLVITIAPKEGERYQGIVNVENENLAKCLETYFHQSEQLPTCLCLFADDQTAGGILLQAMPTDSTEERYHFWEHLIQLTRTLTAKEILNLPNKIILNRLFHEEDVRLFNSESISFHCDCTVDRMERALIIMGEKEVSDILITNKYVTVTCEFCHHHYDFDKSAIEKIFRSL